MKTIIITIFGIIFFSLNHASALDRVMIVSGDASDVSESSVDADILFRLEHEFRAALLDLGISVTNPLYIEQELGVSLDGADIDDILPKLIPYLANSDDSIILLELGLIRGTTAFADPFVLATDAKTGQIMAQATTLPLLQTDSNNITAAAAALARSLERRLQQNGYQTSLADVKPWGGKAHTLRLAFEGFNGCEQETILNIIENEFPGFIGADLEKAPNPNYAIYQLQTTAQTQRIRKWLQLVMVEAGMSPDYDYRLFVSQENLRLKKPDHLRSFYFQCGE
ncbi:MAG: hypothetical protein O2832_01195 [Proteobacteria bacterium]|nr:hypothetical protein [Pseudomonadota bacterium]